MLLYGTEDAPNGESISDNGLTKDINKNLLSKELNIEDDVPNHLDPETPNRGFKDPRHDVQKAKAGVGGVSSGCISFSKSTSQCIGSLLLILFISYWDFFSFDLLGFGFYFIISFSILPFKYLINLFLNYFDVISRILKNALINQYLGDFNELNKTDLAKNITKYCTICTLKQISCNRNPKLLNINDNNAFKNSRTIFRRGVICVESQT